MVREKQDPGQTQIRDYRSLFGSVYSPKIETFISWDNGAPSEKLGTGVLGLGKKQFAFGLGLTHRWRSSNSEGTIQKIDFFLSPLWVGDYSCAEIK